MASNPDLSPVGFQSVVCQVFDYYFKIGPELSILYQSCSINRTVNNSNSAVLAMTINNDHPSSRTFLGGPFVGAKPDDLES